MKSINFVIILLFFFSLKVSGQCSQYDVEVPRINASLSNHIKFDSIANNFIYNYTVKNLSNSIGCINNFSIDLTIPPADAVLSSVGLKDYHKGVFRIPLEMPNALKIVPVGVPSLPRFNNVDNAWLAGFSIYGTIEWHSGYKTFKIAPGQILNGMQITSHGLPCLRKYVISPSYNPKPSVDITPENEDSVRMYTPEPTEEEMEAQLALEESIKVKGLTVGPTAPPINFIATVWCDTLLSYTRQSVTLGWLKSKRDEDCDEDEQEGDGVAKNIEKRIEKAKKELLQGDSVKTRKELEKLVKKVEKIYKKSEEEEKKKHESEIIMTSEAYALLKYNTEYLIERLPGKKEEKEKKGGKD